MSALGCFQRPLQLVYRASTHKKIGNTFITAFTRWPLSERALQCIIRASAFFVTLCECYTLSFGVRPVKIFALSHHFNVTDGENLMM